MNKIVAVLLLLSFTVFSQEKRVQTSVDSTKAKIGAQINLTLKTTVDTLSKVVFPEGNFFGSLEVLESYPTDTLKENFKYHLTKKYGLTQWDSGSYVVPRVEIIINDKSYFSDSLRLEFTSVAVDTLKQQMYDIKEILEAEDTTGNWWKYLLVFLGIIVLGALIYFFVKRSQKPKQEKIVYASPIEKATAHLKLLEQHNWIEKGQVKTYYSELTDIARTYIEEAIEIPAMESTTDELIQAFKKTVVKKKLSLSEETVSNLEKVLKQADLVKFAKSKPLEFEIADHRNKIEKTIFKIHQSIPELVEDDLEDPKLIQERVLKRKRKQQITVVIFVSSFVLFGILVFLTITKGFDYIKDNFIGHPTKDLLEEEWIYSEYGNPPVKIETPKVLKRMNDTKYITNESGSMLQDYQMFGYGSMFDHYYVMVMTSKYKQEIQIDLEKALEMALASMESKGAEILTVKKEVFNSKEGIEGLKAFGSMILLDPVTKKSKKAYYETIYFTQENGLQQIIVLCDEGDEFSNQITDRIMGSLEIGKQD